MTQWLIPIVFVITGLFAGIIGEKIIFNKLKRFVETKKITGSEIIFHAFHRMTFIWLMLAGFFWAILSAPVQPNISNILQKILTTILLYSVTLVIARLTGGFISLFTSRDQGVSTSLISNSAKIAVLVLGTLIILQTLGVQITPLITTLGISGLVVGLALQDTLANLFSGFYLVISKQVRTGDYVKLDNNYQGYVTDINWRNTTIKEMSNNVIIVPNSKLASATFTNYHLPAKEITLSIDVGVSYASDLDLVERVTVEVAKEVMAEIAPQLIENEPFIRFKNFGDFSINFTLYMRVNEILDQGIGKHLLVKKLHKRYQQEEIIIPFPARDVYFQN